MNRYIDTNLDTSAYTAVIDWQCDGERPLVLPGRHAAFSAAEARAKAVKAALSAAGESGLAARVSFTGERPCNFPRSGVTVG